jgi:hypothetical protein
MNCQKFEDHDWIQCLDEFQLKVDLTRIRCRLCAITVAPSHVLDLQAGISARGKFDERIAVALERIAGALCDYDRETDLALSWARCRRRPLLRS